MSCALCSAETVQSRNVTSRLSERVSRGWTGVWRVSRRLAWLPPAVSRPDCHHGAASQDISALPAPQPRAGCSPLTGRPPALSSPIPHSTPGSPPAPQISRKHSSQNYTKAHKHFPQKIANLAGDLKEVTCHLVPLAPKWSAISFFPGVGRGVEKGFFKYFLSSCSWEKVPGF